MKLSAVKKALSEVDQVEFLLPGGEKVPSHFHVTEIGQVKRTFIDCGGTIRDEASVNFQLYVASDYDHRLSVDRLHSIIELSESRLGLEDSEVEVEYQGETIGKYGLDFDGSHFVLTSKQTDCLAKDKCGIPTEKTAGSLATSGKAQKPGCQPGSGCC